jgi:hypothetical protein
LVRIPVERVEEKREGKRERTRGEQRGRETRRRGWRAYEDRFGDIRQNW